MEKLAKNIKRTRESLGLSQFDLAVRAGVSPGTISLLETGKRIPRIETLEKVCLALGVSYSEMVHGEQSIEPEEAEIILARNPHLIKDPKVIEAVLRELLRERIESEDDEAGTGEES